MSMWDGDSTRNGWYGAIAVLIIMFFIFCGYAYISGEVECKSNGYYYCQ